MGKKINGLVISCIDNVAIALEPLKEGETAVLEVLGQEVQIKIIDDIPIYHKFAVVDIKPGEFIYKYGEKIGKATDEIQAGQHVHTHNVCSIREYLEN